MTITVAQSIRHGKYIYLYSPTQKLIKAITQYESEFTSTFDVQDAFTIHVRPIRGRVLGRSLLCGRRLEVDPRFPLRNCLEVVAHEMVHSEQHKHGKLKYAPEPYFREWCDTLYEKLDEKRQWEKYRALPWEEEAWARSKEFINRIWP